MSHGNLCFIFHEAGPNLTLHILQDFSYILCICFAGVFCCSHPYWNVIFTIVVRHKASSFICLVCCSLKKSLFSDETDQTSKTN